MKKLYTTAIAVCISAVLTAQINLRQDKNIIVSNKNLQSQNPVAPSPAVYSNVNLEKSECISKAATELMQKQIDENIKMLQQKNPGACQKTSMVHPLFIWPTQAKPGFTDYGYYTVHNLVDHNPVTNGNLLDYNCGNRTYDWSTGNHAGTDIILWPYAWRRMDEQVMAVVAAAPGVIVNKVDGNFDRNCANNGVGTWNAIHLMHADGSISWYLHFKSGSLTSKIVGDSVIAGEYLGTAGSSGSSDWPHLHFQVFDDTGNLIDPFDGTCNSYNAGDTWWQAQQPYNVPSVNRICTKSTLLDYYNCPNPEITFEKDTFNIGDSLCLWIYTRDLELNSTAQINIYNPAMQNLINWGFTVPWATAPTSYVRWYYIVDPWWTQGWWTFEVVYGGNTYQHQFYMTHSATGINEENTPGEFSVVPNPVSSEVAVRSLEKINEIKITDAVGKIFYQDKIQIPTNMYKLQTAGIPNGIYFIYIMSGKSGSTKKLVISH